MIPIALFGRFEMGSVAGLTLHRRYSQEAPAYAYDESCALSSFSDGLHRPSTARRYLTNI
jgi:hypothetical protein